MKKLIQLFLAGVFSLTGVNVFANNYIKTAELSDIQVTFDGQNLELSHNVIKVQVYDNTYKFIPVRDLLQRFGHTSYWNHEANTLEITHSLLDHYLDMRILHPIVYPINMDNINPNEWIGFSGMSALLSDVTVNMGSNSFVADISYFPITIVPDDVDFNYWIEDNSPTVTTLFSSIIGCNAEEIRSIIVTHGVFTDTKFNAQDIIDSGVLSDEQVEALPLAIEREQRIRAGLGLTKEEIAVSEFKGIVGSIESDRFSTEQLRKLSELIKPHILNM